MAQYSIKNLNYITSGNNRTLVNMDTGLNVNDFYDYVHVLAIEDFKNRPDATLSDILIEQHGADFYKTKYIELCKTRDDNIGRMQDPRLSGHPDLDDYETYEEHEAYWNSILSTECSALALDGSTKDVILLNEQQQYYNDISSASDKWVRLYLSCCSDEYRQKAIDYYNSTLKYSTTYVIEHDQDNESKNKITGQGTTCPMYEFQDVAVKTSNPTTYSNMLNFDAAHPTRSEDWYLPESAQPKEFCQVDDQTYLVTVGTNESPTYLVKNDVSKNSAVDVSYSMRLSSEDLRTHLYMTYADANVSSFSDYFQLSTSSVSDFYKVRKNIPAVDYSYIAKIPMSNIIKRESYTNYDNGNIYAAMMNSKSMYNSTYSMDMPTASCLQNCRTYLDVFSCAGKPYLKFIDNVAYSEDEDGNTRTTVKSKTSYPKVESLVPITTRTTKAHKSYFFSINIDDIGSKLTYKQENIVASKDRQKRSIDELKKEIQHDITQAIRQIVDNVCPVQTQLFEVQFGGNAQQ